MNYKDLTTNEKLDIIGKAVDQLVKLTDSCFHLTDKEKCIVAKRAIGSVTEVFDKRYKAARNKHLIHKELWLLQASAINFRFH